MCGNMNTSLHDNNGSISGNPLSGNRERRVDMQKPLVTEEQYQSCNTNLAQTIYQLRLYDMPEDAFELSAMVAEQLINRSAYGALFDMMKGIMKRYKRKDKIDVKGTDVSNFDYSGITGLGLDFEPSYMPNTRTVTVIASDIKELQ